MSSARLRIDLAYDGAPFAGFARQPDQVTVQGRVEGALSRLLDQPVDIVCAGRTDRGVHARAQVVHLDVDTAVDRAAGLLADLGGLHVRLHQMVGEAITVWRVRRVEEDFHARFAATERRYRYRVADTPFADPLHRSVVWRVGEPLDPAAMRAGASHLRGEHDFASFCRRSADTGTTRRLTLATVVRAASGVLALRFAGPAFCHQQVRSMVGCLVVVGRGRRPPGWVARVRDARDRSAAAAVAPPHGLVLEGVGYGHRWPAAPPARG